MKSVQDGAEARESHHACVCQRTLRYTWRCYGTRSAKVPWQNNGETTINT